MSKSKPKSVAMDSHPLYELTWSQGHGSPEYYRAFTKHEVLVERDAALSLYAALEAAEGFVSVTLKRSSWQGFRPKQES